MVILKIIGVTNNDVYTHAYYLYCIRWCHVQKRGKNRSISFNGCMYACIYIYRYN